MNKLWFGELAKTAALLQLFSIYFHFTIKDLSGVVNADDQAGIRPYKGKCSGRTSMERPQWILNQINNHGAFGTLSPTYNDFLLFVLLIKRLGCYRIHRPKTYPTLFAHNFTSSRTLSACKLVRRLTVHQQRPLNVVGSKVLFSSVCIP